MDYIDNYNLYLPRLFEEPAPLELERHLSVDPIVLNEEIVVPRDENWKEQDEDYYDIFGEVDNMLEVFKAEKEYELLYISYLADFNIESEDNVPTFAELLRAKLEIEQHNNLLEFLAGYFIDHEKDIPTCSEILKEKYRIELFEGFKEIPFDDIHEFDAFHIPCKICLKISSDYYKLDCEHAYCTSCITLYFYSLLDACKIFAEDLQCPECLGLVQEKHFIRHLRHEDALRIEELRAKFTMQKLIAQKKAIACPVPDCPGYAHLIEEEKITACNKCNFSLCTACGMSVHPNLTCEENLENRDETFDRLLLSLNCKKCPTCGVPVEKISGCQFLYCTSPICKGSKHLCFLCGKFLTEALHHAHFKTKGPYGDSCNTLDGIPEDVKIIQE